MRTTSFAPSRRPRALRRAPLLTAAASLATAVLLATASPALGAVAWSLSVSHGPQRFQPDGDGQYVLQAFNVGTTSTSGTYTVVDTLPAGVTPIGTGPSESAWSCDLSAAPTVTCTHPAGGGNRVRPAATDASLRGAAPPLFLTVHVDAGHPLGTLDDTAAISGGGAPADASATDPTPFSDAPAGFGFVPGSFQADLLDGLDASASPVRQAGSHPFEARIDFQANLKLSEDPDDPTFGDLLWTEPDGHVKTLETKLPAGLIGDPQAVPRCNPVLLNVQGPDQKGSCPADTQVGSIDLLLQDEKSLAVVNATTDVPVYNIAPPPGVVAELGLSFIGNPVLIRVSLDPADRYAVVATIPDMIEAQPLRSARLTLWGVPADPAHDPLRVDPTADETTAMGAPFANAPIKPFLTLPAQCDTAGAIRMRADAWDDPGVFTPLQTGATITPTGCDDARFSFQPSIAVRPESQTPSTPTGLDVDLSVPQKDAAVADATDLYAQSGSDAAIATPPLRDATVTLPAGMSVSPSSADGLLACTPVQIGLGTNHDPACPDGSKIGTVSIDTPLLPDPLTGSIYLAAQDDNPFGSLLAIYVVAKGPGVIVKLPGKVAPDPASGQLTTTFLDNPPLPFSRLRLHFDGGPRAPLVTSPTCGVQTTTARFTSWNGSLAPVDATSQLTISADGHGAPCAARGFAPSFSAGSGTPVAGRDTAIVTRFARADADQELRGVDVSLPPGLLARLGSAVLCSDTAANAGTCGDGSRIGTVSIAAGPGPSPFYITDGRAYITGPYKGAPYGLSIVVHAQAGPLDLGDVVVRAQVLVDRATAALRVVSDPLPTILQGIPLQVRLVDVRIDRPGFALNPTSCAPASASARIASTGGASASSSVRFQVGGCAALPFAPKLSLTIGSKGHTKAGISTPLTATLTSGPGQASLRGVKVTLPGTLNALLPVIDRACPLADFQAGRCTSATRVGSAVAVTPLLRDPLRGPVYFVKNPARVLPDLVVALRADPPGQIAIDLTGKVSIPGGRRLASDFDTIPDVPIARFSLRLVSGHNGPVGIVSNLCTARARAATAGVTMRAQSGKVVVVDQRLHVAGCPRPSPATKRVSRR